MNKELTIRNQIEKNGSSVYLVDGEWTSVPFSAFVSPLWRKKSSNFENVLTELGGNLSEYYLYIGGADHNIAELSDDALLVSDGTYYEFKHRDKVTVGDEILYYNAILRKLKGDWNGET